MPAVIRLEAHKDATSLREAIDLGKDLLNTHSASLLVREGWARGGALVNQVYGLFHIYLSARTSVYSPDNPLFLLLEHLRVVRRGGPEIPFPPKDRRRHVQGNVNHILLDDGFRHLPGGFIL